MNQLLFRTIKIADIGYISIIYFFVAMATLFIFDRLFGKFDEQKEKQKSKLQLAFEIIGLIWLAGATTYIIRNIVGDFIPSPFDGIGGFEHKRVKELTNAGVFVFIFMYYFKYLKQKMDAFYDKLVEDRHITYN
jgi:hypothetical protein